MGKEHNAKKQLIDESPVPCQGNIDVKEARRDRKRLDYSSDGRIKELECIHNITRVIDRQHITSGRLYQEVTNLLTDGWQYPDIGCARITIDGKEFRTENYRETGWRLSSDIKIHEVVRGTIEVCYLAERPRINEGPFSKGERYLIDIVADLLGRIYERKEAEEAQWQSSERLRRMFESVNDGIIVMNLNGIISEANERLLKMTGYDNVKELSGRSILELTAPQDYQSVMVNLEEAIRTGVTRNIEYSYLKADGSEFLGGTSTCVLRDTSGNPAGFIATVRDISERKRLKKLEYSLGERVRELECLNGIAHITERVWLTEDELYEQVANLLPASSGYPRIDCVRITIDGKEFKTQNYRETEWQLSSDILVQEVKAGAVEVNYVNPDIEREPFLSEARLYFETVAKRLGSITEYIRSREALRNSEEFSSNLLSSSPIPVLVINPDTSIRYVNPALEKSTGFSSSKLIGKKPPYPWWTDETIDKSGGNLERNIHEGAKRVEVPLKAKDGKRFCVDVTFVPVKSNGRLKYCMLSWIDTTEQKQLRENMHLYIMEGTRAQEKERKRIALELHDETIQVLCSLLTDIDEIIAKSRQLSREGTRRLKRLQTKVGGIMAEVRHFSHELRPGVLDQFGLVPSLELLIEEGKKKAKLNCRIEVIGFERRLAPEAELALFRITQEALRNVRKHSKATEARVRVEFTKKKAKLTITDNGSGFELPQVLGSFVREGKLGLMGISERTRSLGGSISIESKVGKGTTVVVEIPA